VREDRSLSKWGWTIERAGKSARAFRIKCDAAKGARSLWSGRAGTLNTLSMKCKYALRALYRLSRDYERGPVLIADVSETERIPRKFLEAILLQLKRVS
jgi:hypothetical protein